MAAPWEVELLAGTHGTQQTTVTAINKPIIHLVDPQGSATCHLHHLWMHDLNQPQAPIDDASRTSPRLACVSTLIKAKTHAM